MMWGPFRPTNIDRNNVGIKQEKGWTQKKLRKTMKLETETETENGPKITNIKLDFSTKTFD